MKEYDIELIETIVHRFTIAAEDKKDARDIVVNSWEVYNRSNMETIKDSDINILVYERVQQRSKDN